MFGIFGVEYTSYLGKFTKKLAAKATKKISKRKSNSKNNSSSEPETTSQTDYHPTGNAKNAELIIIMQNNNQTKKPETTPQTIGAAKKAKKPETLNDWKKRISKYTKQMDQLSKTLRGEKDLKKTSEISKELSELIENESSIKRIITSMERKNKNESKQKISSFKIKYLKNLNIYDAIIILGISGFSAALGFANGLPLWIKIIIFLVAFCSLICLIIPSKKHNCRLYVLILRILKFKSSVKKYKLNSSNDTKLLIPFKRIIDNKYVETFSSVGKDYLQFLSFMVIIFILIIGMIRWRFFSTN
ncbi:Uncharacterised protein (plasmid) [Mesomycoplasma conjunctivae]|nr:Uncharacterised protein [Mesomycoplasma conjunctivae]